MLRAKLNMPLTVTLMWLTVVSAARIGHLYPKPPHETPEYWPEEARREMDRASRVMSQLRYSAKNVILFIGDGMGISTVTAGRILKGQLAKSSGEEATLSFDALDHAGLIRTYNTDRQTSDSASTATAFLCGVKTNQYTTGVNQKVSLGSCRTYNSTEHDLVSFLKMASDQGRSTGVLTTSGITSHTPAPAYANSVSRKWQDDTDRDTDSSSPDTPEERKACPDIATQMIEKGVNLTVLMGGGRLKFLPKNATTLDQFANKNVTGTRSDGVDLVERWRQRQSEMKRRAVYVETADELANVTSDSVDCLLGLLATEKMQHHVTNIKSTGYREPSLAQMTRKTIEILAKNPNGFALFVEGALIDSGHHANQAQRALYDLIAFDEAIQTAVNMTSPEDTLIVVSADHSHVFSIGYYGFRGQPILGKVIADQETLEFARALDDIEYTVITYGDGSSANANQSRTNISADTPEDSEDYQYPSLVPRKSESHAAEDVSVNARGPGAHLFHSLHEQSYIAHVIMRAACLGWYAETGNCLRDPGATTTGAPQGSTTKTAISTMGRGGGGGGSGGAAALLAMIIVVARICV